MLISLSNVSNLLQNGHFFYCKLILVAIFVTIAMVEVKLIPYFYTWAIVLINQYEELGEKHFLFFNNSPLMHIALRVGTLD